MADSNRQSEAPEEHKPANSSQSTTNYANSFASYGFFVGMILMFKLPNFGTVGNFIAGAICGVGGTAIGSAVGLFFDSFNEPFTSSGMPSKTGIAVASLILGMLGIVAWLIPPVGIAVTIAGFVLGRMARLSSKRNFALTGMGLSLLGLLLSIGNGFLGALLAVNNH